MCNQTGLYTVSSTPQELALNTTTQQQQQSQESTKYYHAIIATCTLTGFFVFLLQFSILTEKTKNAKRKLIQNNITPLSTNEINYPINEITLYKSSTRNQKSTQQTSIITRKVTLYEFLASYSLLTGPFSVLNKKIVNWTLLLIEWTLGLFCLSLAGWFQYIAFKDEEKYWYEIEEKKFKLKDILFALLLSSGAQVLRIIMTATTNLGKLTRIFTIFISLAVLIQTAIVLYKTFDNMSEEYFIHWLYEAFIAFGVLILLIDPLAQLLLYFFLEPTVQEIPFQLEKQMLEEKEQEKLQKTYADAQLQAMSKPYIIQEMVDYTYPAQSLNQLKPYQQSDQSIVSSKSDYSQTQDSAQGIYSDQSQKRQRKNYKATKEPYIQKSNPSQYKAIQRPDRSGQSPQLPHIVEEPTDKRY